MANSLAAFALGWCFRLVNLGISEVGIITWEVTNYQAGVEIAGGDWKANMVWWACDGNVRIPWSNEQVTRGWLGRCWIYRFSAPLFYTRCKKFGIIMVNWQNLCSCHVLSRKRTTRPLSLWLTKSSWSRTVDGWAFKGEMETLLVFHDKPG